MCNMPPLMLFLADQYTSEAPDSALHDNQHPRHTSAGVEGRRGMLQRTGYRRDQAQCLGHLQAASGSMHVAHESWVIVTVGSRGHVQKLQEHYSSERLPPALVWSRAALIAPFARHIQINRISLNCVSLQRWVDEACVGRPCITAGGGGEG